MLRRRRQSLPGGEEDTPTLEGEGAVMKQRKTKMKMSPFPEVKGVPLKESSHRLNTLSEVKTSLHFRESAAQIEVGAPVSLTNTPISHSHPLETVTYNPPLTSATIKRSSHLSTFEATSSGSQQSSSCADWTHPNSELNKPSVLVPTSEYVIPDTSLSVSSEREINLGSFPPQSGSNRTPMKSADSAMPGPSCESTIKPSTVLKMERYLTPSVARQPRRSRGGSLTTERRQSENQSASISSMWDNVVSWMKQAVDFVTVEADPTNTPIPHGKKRPHPDATQPVPESKVAKLTNQRAAAGKVTSGRQSKRNSRRMSFGGFRGEQDLRFGEEGLGQLLPYKLQPIEESTSPPAEPIATVSKNIRGSPSQFESPTSLLTNQLSQNLVVKSPQDKTPTGAIVNPNLFKFAAQRLQSTNNGLNSILDGSPLSGVPRKKPSRIRRQSLSQYYGRSVNSPNLYQLTGEGTTVRRSPRLASTSSKTPPSNVPVAPPPPPLPHTQHAPPPPPTPKIPSMYDCDLSEGSSTPGRNGMDQSRAMLQKMQSRLRTRMKKKIVGGERNIGGEGKKEIDKVDIKTRQWAEIQALSRKIPVSQFIAMVEIKKQEIRKTLEELQVKVPGTPAGISETVELLHDASQWFSGGNKEMRDSLPLYKSLEKKIEMLNEFTQLCTQIRESCQAEIPQGVHYSKLHTTLSHVRSEFDSKHRHWGPVVLTNALSWLNEGLPVCHKLLLRGRQYICHLVEVFVSCTLLEADKMEGILLSLKCMRTSQVMERLRECMQLLKNSQSYFQLAPFNETCNSCSQCQSLSSAEDCTNYVVSTLLKYTLDVSLSYINIALGQFDGFVSRSSRQEVCEHFEAILKMINLVKSLVCEINNTKPSRVKATGVICLIPDGESLGSVIYTSCVSLIQHIMSQTKACVAQGLSPSREEKISKEVILWMMFGCKYVHQTLEVLGSEKADESGVANLLSELQQMENLLPTF